LTSRQADQKEKKSGKVNGRRGEKSRTGKKRGVLVLKKRLEGGDLRK